MDLLDASGRELRHVKSTSSSSSSSGFETVSGDSESSRDRAAARIAKHPAVQGHFKVEERTSSNQKKAAKAAPAAKKHPPPPAKKERPCRLPKPVRLRGKRLALAIFQADTDEDREIAEMNLMEEMEDNEMLYNYTMMIVRSLKLPDCLQAGKTLLVCNEETRGEDATLPYPTAPIAGQTEPNCRGLYHTIRPGGYQSPQGAKDPPFAASTQQWAQSPSQAPHWQPYNPRS